MDCSHIHLLYIVDGCRVYQLFASVTKSKNILKIKWVKIYMCSNWFAEKSFHSGFVLFKLEPYSYCSSFLLFLYWQTVYVLLYAFSYVVVVGKMFWKHMNFYRWKLNVFLSKVLQVRQLDLVRNIDSALKVWPKVPVTLIITCENLSHYFIGFHLYCFFLIMLLFLSF